MGPKLGEFRFVNMQKQLILHVIFQICIHLFLRMANNGYNLFKLIDESEFPIMLIIRM